MLPFHRIAGAKYERLNMPDKMLDAVSPTDEVMNNVRARFGELGIKIAEGE